MSESVLLNRISHVKGCRTEPIWNKTIPEFLKEVADDYGNNPALVFPGRVNWNYNKLNEEVDQLAAGLVKLGINKGDRVGIWSPNKPEWVVLQLATARIGAILVTINPAYRPIELEHVLVKAGIKALFSATSFKNSDYLGMLRSLIPEIDKGNSSELTSPKFPTLQNIIKIGGSSDSQIMDYQDVKNLGSNVSTKELDRISAHLKPGNSINIQFTSGTTGAPKGATLSHRNIINNARFVTDTIQLDQNDKLCLPVPLYHCFGMVMGVLGCITKGACIVLPDESFCPKATLEAISELRCTGLYSVPTMFISMLDLLASYPLNIQSLRTGIMAGAPCPIEVMRRVTSDMHMSQVTIAYGMTETSPVSFQSHVDDPLEKRVTTVGRIHPHAEVKIIDEEGCIVPVGSQGEICTRGYLVMKEYWEDEQATKSSIDSDGWMHTGDLGILDQVGYCTITGRLNDMIIRGGENIYPKEVEDFLFLHPQVKDVQVFGVPDEQLGEEVCAWVILKTDEHCDESMLQQFCQGKIAHYKIPKYFRFKSEFPMTVTGKPQKFLMRASMLKELDFKSNKL